VRGARVKNLRRSFIETYGFTPPKTRRVLTKVRPTKWYVRLWWWISRHEESYIKTYQSQWRKWKRMAKASDHA
jgi:hypothetical protein